MCLIIIVVIFVYIIIKIYLKLTTGWCKNQTCLINRTVIVTGANTGIGYETALDFAKRGARVILACRDKVKAEDARLQIISITGNENIVVKTLDMASFDSVRVFAKEIIEKEDRLDILVNNAGTFLLDDKKTIDGIPLVMQINHFSAFLLTNLLLDFLKKSTPSRVVNVSSHGAQGASLDINKLDKHVSPEKNYFNSKLCNILFTQELAKRLKGSGVTTYSVHPGIVRTNILNNIKGPRQIISAVLLLFAKTVEEGAQTTIYCSVAKGIENYSGEHFSDCQRVKPYRTARDTELYCCNVILR